MRNLIRMLLASLPLVGLACSAAPRQCVSDVNYADKAFQVKHSGACHNKDYGLTCPKDRPCAMFVMPDGVLGDDGSHIGPINADGWYHLTDDWKIKINLYGFIMRPDEDGKHTDYECAASACDISFTGEQKVNHLTKSQRIRGPDTARVTFVVPENLPSGMIWVGNVSTNKSPN